MTKETNTKPQPEPTTDPQTAPAATVAPSDTLENQIAGLNAQIDEIKAALRRHSILPPAVETAEVATETQA